VDEFLNAAFFVFHTTWIAFTSLGWIWRKTRPWQVATALLTALSWFGLGVWYGWGYCPCTDWHWRVRLRMGFDDPPSYIQLLIRVLTGIVVEPRIADALALVTLAVATLLSLMLRARARGQSNL
jgi:Protein of Unknown function (DUF2784)